MHTRFRTQAATFRTGERRLLALAQDVPPFNSAAMGEVPETIKDLKTPEFEQKILNLLKSADEDAKIVKACRTEVLNLIKNDPYWKTLDEREKRKILEAFPKRKIDFMEFAVDNNFLAAEASLELKELWEQRPSHVHTYADTVTKVTYLPDGMEMSTFEELVQRWEKVKMDLAKTFRGYNTNKNTPPDVLEARAVATAAQQAMQAELAEKLGADWSVRIAEYKSRKTLDRRAQILKKEEIGRQEDEARGIKRGGQNTVEPWDAEIQRGLRNSQRRNDNPHSKYGRAAAKLRENDFVDNGQIPTYEVKFNPKLRVKSFDSKTGTYRDRTAERNEFMKGKEMDYSQNPNGEPLGSRKRPAKVTSRPAMFGPGTVSSQGHDDLVRQSTSHLDTDVQNKLRAEAGSRAYQQLRKDIINLDKEYPNAHESQSFTVLQDFIRRGEYQKAIDQIGILRRELKQMNSLTAIGDKVNMQAQSLDVEDSPYFTVNVKNMLTGKTYSFKPQLVLSTNEASNDAATVQSLYASEGVAIRFDRLGDRITGSTQKKVSSMAIDLTNPDSKYFTVTTNSRNNNNALELGNPALKPAPYDTGAPENEPVGNTRKVTLDFSKGIPRSISIINKTKQSKDGNADSFTGSQLEGLADGASLRGGVAGVTIRKEGDAYTMSLDNASQYSVRELGAGVGTDYKDISNTIPGLNPGAPLQRSMPRPAPARSAAMPSMEQQEIVDPTMRSFNVTFTSGLPFGLNISNNTTKKATTFFNDELKTLDTGAILTNPDIGVTIQKVNGQYRVSLKKGNHFEIIRVNSPNGTNRDDISRYIPGLNNGIPDPAATQTQTSPTPAPTNQVPTIQPRTTPAPRPAPLPQLDPLPQQQAPFEGPPATTPEAPLSPPPVQRAPETVQNGPTQQEFTAQRDEIIAKTNVLVRRMNTYKGKEWMEYTNRFRNNIQLRIFNYDPQNRLLNNGRRTNEWNLEQLKKTFDVYAPSAEARMNEWDEQNAAKSLPPDFPETAVERPAPAASPAAGTRPKTNVEKINEITDSLPAVTQTPSATPAPKSNADAINRIADDLPKVPQAPEAAPSTAPNGAGAIDEITNNLPKPLEAKPEATEANDAKAMEKLKNEFDDLLVKATTEVERLTTIKYANIKEVEALMQTLKDAKNNAATVDDMTGIIGVLNDALNDMKKEKGDAK